MSGARWVSKTSPPPRKRLLPIVLAIFVEQNGRVILFVYYTNIFFVFYFIDAAVFLVVAMFYSNA